jgi:hypothetical protein
VGLDGVESVMEISPQRVGALVPAFIVALMVCVGEGEGRCPIAQEAQDRVRLKNGAEVKAKVLSMTSENVTYSEAGGNVVTAKKGDVMTVDLGDQPPGMDKAAAALLNKEIDQAISSYRAALEEIRDKKGGRELHKQFIYLKLAEAMSLKGLPDEALRTLRDLRETCGDCWLRADSYQRSLEIAKVKGGEAYDGVVKEMTEEKMTKQFMELRKLRPDQVIEIDAGLEAILQEHEPMKKDVVKLYGILEREHVKVHQRMTEHRMAMKQVNPFVAKHTQIKAKPDEYKNQAQQLYDECRALLDSYGATAFGEKLREIQAELRSVLEGNEPPTWEQTYVPLLAEVRTAAKKGEFAVAGKQVDDFGAKFNEKDNPELSRKLTEVRDYLKRESLAFVHREVTRGQKGVAEGTLAKEDFKKRLEGFTKGLEGYTDALGKLEAAIASIR